MERATKITAGVLLLARFTGCSSCAELDLGGGEVSEEDGVIERDIADLNLDTDIFALPETPEMPDFIREPDIREPYSDLYPPDPSVPDFWDVDFDYLDMAGEDEPDPALCGNGELDPGEECDDGNTNDNDECTNRCTLPRCGDGSVWYVMEDCDPPGTTRPCMTECGSSGLEWCEPFCRWEGTCVPPLEVCGNGMDDDCDGVTDSIVRLTPMVPVSDMPVSSESCNSHIVWTSSEFAVTWGDDDGRTILSRLDRWGIKADWDRPVDMYFGGGSDGFLDMYWTGSLLGCFSILYTPLAGLFLRSMHEDGSPASDWLLVTSDDLGFSERHMALSGSEYGIVFKRTDHTETSFFTAAADGSAASEEVILDFGEELARPKCIGAADTGFVVAARISNEWHGSRSAMARIAVDGTIIDIVNVDHPAEGYNCIFAGEYLVSLSWSGDSSHDYVLTFNAPDGSLVASRTVTSDLHIDHEDTSCHRSSASTAPLVWTGSEIGLFWSDGRNGNDEIYFVRADTSATPLTEPVRLTHTPTSSRYPSATWDGEAYAVTWRDSSGTDDDIYFTRFSGCP